MGDYQRTTISIRLEILPADITAALQAHQDDYNLGNILHDYLECVETVSEKKKKGLFKGPGDKRITSYTILTPTWLVYAVVDDDGTVSVLSVPLAEAKVEDYKTSPFYSKMPDNGYHVTGNFTGQVGMHGSQRVTIFLGLGEERDARVFGETLMDGIAKTRR